MVKVCSARDSVNIFQCMDDETLSEMSLSLKNILTRVCTLQSKRNGILLYLVHLNCLYVKCTYYMNRINVAHMYAQRTDR